MPALKNPKHEKFAQLVASGMSLTNAYRKIKGKECGTQPANCGHSLRKRPDIDARIGELVEEDNKRIELNKEDVIRMLAQMLQMAPDEAHLSSNLCDMRIAGKDTAVPVTTDRLKTIERLARLQGWDKETVEFTASKQVLEVLEEFAE